MIRVPRRALLAGGGALVVGGRQAAAQTPRNTLVIAAQIGDLVALDPHHSFEVTGSDLLKNVYDQLFAIDETKASAELLPGIAESFSVSPDGRTFTFGIRRNVRFHSGNALTAADVAFSLRRPLLINRTPAFMYRSAGSRATMWSRLSARPAISRCRSPSTRPMRPA